MNMNGVAMNFKSGILKLSILIMLVLVLLPAIAAEDSSEAFYVEYTYESAEEVIVEDSGPVYEVEEAWEDVSPNYEMKMTVDEEEIGEDVHFQDQSAVEIDDAVMIQEEVECSVVETYNNNIDVIEEGDELFNNEFCEDVIDNVNYNDIDDVDRDVTIEDFRIIKQGSVIFVSEEVNDNSNIILINELFTEATNYETNGFKRSLIKALELKNNLLINQEVSFVFADNCMADVDGDIIVCTDKITTDFVFSIDNSVVGGADLIIFSCTSFCLDFTPFYDAFIFCNFFDFESFFGGVNKIQHSFSLSNSYFNIVCKFFGLFGDF